MLHMDWALRLMCKVFGHRLFDSWLYSPGIKAYNGRWCARCGNQIEG